MSSLGQIILNIGAPERRPAAPDLFETMMETKGDTGPLQPWYKRRASARTISAPSILLLSSFVFIALSSASFAVVQAMVPNTTDISFFTVQAGYEVFDDNGDSPVLKLGTFGHCIS
ncbi:hypothetical protein F5Y14DRAFT_453203 [Nemania sp. NC0429]|nr:hypothetical protein F5Y14DRAFT_453203 [Nemania sp. NC0429]